MPLYNYRCLQCDQTFEALRRISDADEGVICPKCQSDKVERLVSSFAISGCKPGARFT